MLSGSMLVRKRPNSSCPRTLRAATKLLTHELNIFEKTIASKFYKCFISHPMTP